MQTVSEQIAKSVPLLHNAIQSMDKMGVIEIIATFLAWEINGDFPETI